MPKGALGNPVFEQDIGLAARLVERRRPAGIEENLARRSTGQWMSDPRTPRIRKSCHIAPNWILAGPDDAGPITERCANELTSGGGHGGPPH